MGAGGYPSSLLLPALIERYEFVTLDERREGGRRAGKVYPNRGDPIVVFRDSIIEVDLADPDIKKYRAYFKDIDAVIHNGWVYRDAMLSNAPVQWLEDRPANNPDSYCQERDNLDMAFHVFKLAIEEGVRRVIVTSSNHAEDWYETKLNCRKLNTIGPGTYPLSDNCYGWAKASYEHIGFIFATGRIGRAVENAQSA